MKPIIIHGKEYYYQVFLDTSDLDETSFYKKEIVTRKKYYLWGEKIKVDEYNRVFRVSFNIESPYISKEYIRKEIDKELAILKRAEEIKRGEIL